MSTSRSRAPLASIPNATNSPHRSLTQSIGKRSRQQGPVLQENEPPQKRQIVEKKVREDAPTTPRRRVPPSTAEGRVFERGSTATQPTDFHRKLIASKKEAEQPSIEAADTTIRAWQRHYRKVFPAFVFYFDSIPDDVRARFSKHIGSFGAQEEKFFSKAVTHVVTTRPIPVESPSSDTSSTKSGSHPQRTAEDQPRTINPSLLEKNAAIQAQAFPAKIQSGASMRRDGSTSMDVLSRGRQMGMKLWALEKLQRILVSMLEYDAANGQNPRAIVTTAGNTRVRDEDLSQVLRNEKLNGPLDRDVASSTKELVPFKGPFIYVHDMDAKTRPIMVREYPKVARRQDGAWPQFRSAAVGKCPFIDDPVTKREIEREKERERAMATQQAKEAQQTPRTRSVSANQDVQMDPPRRSPRKALREVHNPPAPAPAFKDIVPKAHAFEAPKALPQMSFARHDPNTGFMKPQHMHFAREPAASGIQQSNLTSAIRSQMISSTAAAPGAKAGISKEVNELKRKVLERSHTGSLSVGSIPSSHRMTDIAGALKSARAPAPQRAAKSRAQEKLGGITEEAGISDDELAAERGARAPGKKKKAARKDPKSGYCENCRDKYDDFDDHVLARKHRKFALTQSNWTELDQLLRKLQQDP